MKFRNQQYYEKIKTSPSDSVRPFFNKSNWLTYAIMAILSVAVAPFLTMKRSHVVPSSPDVYFHQVKFFTGALVLIIIPLLWIMQLRPYLEMKDGHYYVGRFKLIDKRQVLGYCYFLLMPGKRNWIKVSQKMFYSIKVGETIELKRASLGTIDGIKIIRNIRRRISSNYVNRKYKERQHLEAC